MDLSYSSGYKISDYIGSISYKWGLTDWKGRADEKKQGNVNRHPRDARGGGETGVSGACTAREQRLQYSRKLQAILTDFAYPTRGLCKQNLTGLLVKLGDIACYTRRDCLLRRLTTDVTLLK